FDRQQQLLGAVHKFKVGHTIYLTYLYVESSSNSSQTQCPCRQLGCAVRLWPAWAAFFAD
ncbi:MAG: hypothetical protein KA309_01940, partial [Giesbergeria sp.]|nr:hypothetical protein [Giesbergeria sp.]